MEFYHQKMLKVKSRGKMKVKAEIITIGDELLLGQTIDTNSAWMGEHLHNLGIDVFQITSITDDPKHIITTLREAEKRADLVLITGGLGPTQDDLTKQTLVDYFDTTLVLNQTMHDKIEAFFREHKLPMIASNIQQAYLPQNCEPIINEIGTAAGMWFEERGKVFVSMPGVPREMKKMMKDSVLPRIKQHFSTQELVYRMVYTVGIGESFLVEKILDWENSLEESDIKIAYLPERGKVKIRLSSQGKSRNEIIQRIDEKIEELKKLVPEYIVSESEFQFSAIVGKLLQERSETVATAESCTGGAIASTFTNVAGSSSYFLGSVVAYHEKIKAKILGVNADDIDRFGVVSQEIAEQMALGVVKNFGSDWGISTTGIAGPTGGDERNPIGTVWIGIAHGNFVTSKRFIFEGKRMQVIEKATKKSILMLKEKILSAGADKKNL